MTAIELGAYGYVVKPVRAGELLINVANALHRRRCETREPAPPGAPRARDQERSEQLAEALEAPELAENQIWPRRATRSSGSSGSPSSATRRPDSTSSG